ncbi:transcription factor FAMA [Cannabis sativa]|uniref:transcription factor FAMA n=1 Tax=Cannabis sativa TaxID=3483 RepID=UPI0029C9DB90|nr:transcription factor FAMA [Cannabis sativa]
MEKENNYSAPIMPPNNNNNNNFSSSLDNYNIENIHHHQQQFMKSHIDERSEEGAEQNGVDERIMVNYLLNNNNNNLSHHHHQHNNQQLSFADVMQFADFGPKLGLNQTEETDEAQQLEENSMVDPVYFLKFPVLNDDNNNNNNNNDIIINDVVCQQQQHEEMMKDCDVGGDNNDNDDGSMQHLQFLGEDLHQNNGNGNGNSNGNNKNKRKRPRTVKTSEEVESQRMTHIAVERNRRKQMNEHLRVLRSLMPGSYVQRGDQASIIGGAIEFVRELEQLLQCLESQKRRRLVGDQPPPPRQQLGSADQGGGGSTGGVPIVSGAAPGFFPLANNDQMMMMNSNNKFVAGDFEINPANSGGGLREEMAENKSCLADVEVKLLGFDAMIKILSRRRPGQLIKAIAALEDLQFNILHTNITTIEQTVLYSFNVKVTSDSRFTAEDIACSVQQIFSFIHANSL